MRITLRIILIILTICTSTFAQGIILDPEDLAIAGHFLPNDRFGPHASFTLSNDGEEAIEIEISCDLGWLTFQPSEFSVEPNESQEIEVYVDLREPLDPDNYGLEISFMTDDPDMDEIILATELIQLEPPILGEIGDIEFQMNLGAIDTTEFALVNNGVASLNFIIETELIEEEEERNQPENATRFNQHPQAPRRDPAGDLIAIIDEIEGIDDLEGCIPVAYDWENEWMWVTHYSEGRVYAVSFDRDYENVQVVRTIRPGNCMDGAWLNGIFYTTTLGNRQIQRYDANGESIGNLQVNYNVYGLAADVDEKLLFVQESGNNQGIHVFPISNENELGEEIGLIDNWAEFNDNSYVYGLEWVPAHEEGQLWMCHRDNDNVYQIHVDTEQWQADGAVQDFGIEAAGNYLSVAHDGRNLWVPTDNISIYHDGINEQPLLLWVVPERGLVDPDGELVVSLIIEAWDSGQFEALLHIYTNDPENLDIELQVTVVVDRMPIMFTNPSQISFGEVVEDQQSVIDLDIFCQFLEDDLTITGISTDSEYFISNFEDEIIVSLDDTVSIQITFLPDSIRDYNGVLTITTDNELIGEKTVVLNGVGIEANSINDEVVEFKVHPTKAYFVLCIALIFSLKNSISL